MWEFQCGRCPHFQKDREKHKDAWVGSLKAADFTMDMLISLVMLDEWTILFDPIWSIWGCRNLEALKSTCFPFLEDGHLRLGGLIHLSSAQYLIVPTSSTPAWSVPCPIAYIHIIRIPRSTTAAKTTPIKWGEAAGISSCGPSLREVGSWNMLWRSKNWDNKFIHPWHWHKNLVPILSNSIGVWLFFVFQKVHGEKCPPENGGMSGMQESSPSREMAVAYTIPSATVRVPKWIPWKSLGGFIEIIEKWSRVSW